MGRLEPIVAKIVVCELNKTQKILTALFYCDFYFCPLRINFGDFFRTYESLFLGF